MEEANDARASNLLTQKGKTLEHKKISCVLTTHHRHWLEIKFISPPATLPNNNKKKRNIVQTHNRHLGINMFQQNECVRLHIFFTLKRSCNVSGSNRLSWSYLKNQMDSHHSASSIRIQPLFRLKHQLFTIVSILNNHATSYNFHTTTSFFIQ